MERERSCIKTCSEKSMTNSYRKNDQNILEGKSHKQRVYDKIMKESRDFYKELDYVTIKAPKREIAGPPWYQELSIHQINIVNDLKNHIKNDFDDSSTQRVRRALRELGIQTKIPHSVAKNAILHSKLYSINFLQIIMEYLRNKINHVTKKTELLKYTTEECILSSGIVHLGLPSLFMKLDYCLSGPITKKKQPLNLYEKSLHKNQKIQSNSLNMKEARTKKQKSRKNIIKEKKTKQDITIRNIELKTKNSDPMHPLDTLFVQLPLDTLFENKKHDNFVVQKKIEENKVNEEIECITREVPNVMTNKDFINENVSNTYNDVTNNKKYITENYKHLSTTESSIFQNQKQEKSNHNQLDTVVIPSIITNETYLSDYTSYDRQDFNFSQLIHLKKSIIFEYDEYEEVDEESEVEETIEDEDFSFLTDNQEENKHDENVILKTDIEQSLFGKHPNNIDKSQFSEKLNNKNISQVLDISPMASIMDNQSKIENSLVRMFNYQKCVFRDYQLHYIGVKVPKQDNKQNVYGIRIIDEKKIKNRNRQSMNVIPKVELNFSETKSTPFNNIDPDDISNQCESEDSVKDEDISQNCVSGKKNMRKTHIYDEILENTHKLSKWKKLKKVLEFLAILGDPIASLPNIIKLHVIRHWYVSRLNINNSQLTANQKAELLNYSKRLWRSPKSKILSIPRNLLGEKQHCAQLTWDKKNMVLKKINKAKDSYTKQFKQQTLNHSREMYPTFKTIHYKNQLNKDFKRTYYSYFPAKEGDILWR